MSLLILVVAIAFIALWAISVQNRLVKMDEICMNSLRQINVQQQSRFDALKTLVSMTREYSSYESDTLEKVIQARLPNSSQKPAVSDINACQETLDMVSSKIVALAERYPELKADRQYLKTMEEVTRYEENVRLSRMTFNDTVTRFNSQVRMFPASLMASFLHFSPKEYLAENKEKSEYPSI